ncbi:MAG: putative toxin-antitoxin system toxin component, PIN family [Deltaproteobacteria bacterium]|nr:MAG: putative toxin-antitoxin system toxin component, PIN family [Deltaproteobacteria bacterium]
MITLEMRKVVIDTNVIVSALLFGGKPGELIPLWENGRVEPIVSREIIDEYVRVLAYPKFELTEKEIRYLVYQQLLPYFHVVKTYTGQVIVQKDPSDDKFIRCALAGNAKVIVSGDIHLLSLKVYQDIHMLTPSQFIDSTSSISRKKSE